MLIAAQSKDVASQCEVRNYPAELLPHDSFRFVNTGKSSPVMDEELGLSKRNRAFRQARIRLGRFLSPELPRKSSNGVVTSDFLVPPIQSSIASFMPLKLTMLIANSKYINESNAYSPTRRVSARYPFLSNFRSPFECQQYDCPP